LINIPSQSPNRPRTHPFFSNGFRLQPTLLAAPEPALAAAMPRICHERSFFATARTPPKLLPFNSPPKPRDRLRLAKKLDVADELSLRQLVPQDVLPRTCVIYPNGRIVARARIYLFFLSFIENGSVSLEQECRVRRTHHDRDRKSSGSSSSGSRGRHWTLQAICHAIWMPGANSLRRLGRIRQGSVLD
jgi:hypothetical protein